MERRVGLGVITYNRPDIFDTTMRAILDVLDGEFQSLVVFNDASDERYRSDYRRIYRDVTGAGGQVITGKVNGGVAHAKNLALKALFDDGCTELFLAEDDIIPQNSRAIRAYLEAHDETGIGLMNFAHHGDANKEPRVVDPPLAFWPNCVGGWTFYTRECLDTVGALDERFHNSWELAEHVKRAADAGFTSPFWYFADIIESPQCLAENPASLVRTVVERGPAAMAARARELQLWSKKDGVGLPELPAELLEHPWVAPPAR